MPEEIKNYCSVLNKNCSQELALENSPTELTRISLAEWAKKLSDDTLYTNAHLRMDFSSFREKVSFSADDFILDFSKWGFGIHKCEICRKNMIQFLLSIDEFFKADKKLGIEDKLKQEGIIQSVK